MNRPDKYPTLRRRAGLYWNSNAIRTKLFTLTKIFDQNGNTKNMRYVDKYILF